jgi:hypothetical protein
MIQDSDIGPVNSTLSIYNFVQYLKQVMYSYFTRYLQIFIIFYWLVMVIFPDIQQYTAVGSWKLGFYLLFDFGTFLLIKFMMYKKIKTVETTWYGHKAQKLIKTYGANG